MGHYDDCREGDAEYQREKALEVPANHQTKEYYECHITILGDAENAKPAVIAQGWKFSSIDGDPDLGEGVKCYATRHFNKRHGLEHVKAALFATSHSLAHRFTILQKKVELVVYDSLIDKGE